MKNIILHILLYISPMFGFTQIVSPDGGPVLGIGLGTLSVEDVTPVPEVIDTMVPPDLSGDRSVVWVHGLSGHGDASASDESNSWIQASSSSDINFQIQSRRPDYSDVSLDAASTSLRTQLEDYELREDAYIIAHSQGGIVTRELDRYINDFGWERTFNGVVTFGTPHGGAMILNNRDLIVEWIASMCSDLGSGPWLEEVNDVAFFTALALFTDIESYDDLACDLLIEHMLPFAFNMDAYYAGVTDGYYVGSTELEELNTYTPDIPYVAFWGEETEPVSWNTMVHMLPGKSVNSEVYGPFGANNDAYLKNQANTLQDYYYGKYLEYDHFIKNWKDAFWLIVDFFVDDAAVTNNEISDAYLDGYNWFVNANNNWKIIIGAREYVYSSNISCLCIDVFDGYEQWYLEDDLEDITCSEIEFYYEPFSDCNEVVDLVLVDIVDKINDGVVLKESASTCPGMVSGAKMEGSNHFSMRNDSETEERLNELYSGIHGGHFLIEPR